MGIPQRLWTAIANYLLFLSGSQLTSTKAIVLASADSATNKSGSRSGLRLDHVGIVNHGESGVYLGNYHGESWVLTANHSGPGLFELVGMTYNAAAGSTHQLSMDRSSTRTRTLGHSYGFHKFYAVGMSSRSSAFSTVRLRRLLFKHG